MKVPKTMKRYCPKCKTHTDHKVTQYKNKGRNATHHLSLGALVRLKRRGTGKDYGMGNKGKYSKPPKPKRQGVKVTKKAAFVYECQVCHKKTMSDHGVRVKKVEIQ